VVPAIIVLTGDDGAMAAAMRSLGWTIVDIDPPAATADSSGRAAVAPSLANSAAAQDTSG